MRQRVVSNFGTSLGNGIVQQFVYVTEEAFANDDPYTEAYLFEFQGATVRAAVGVMEALVIAFKLRYR